MPLLRSFLPLLTLVALLACSDRPPAPLATSADTASAPRAWPPTFEQYATTDTLTGPAAPVDYSADPDARRFRSRLEGTRKADFAGHFAVVTWGCGTNCTDHLVLDLRTGRPNRHSLLDLSCGSVAYTVRSTLIIAGPDTSSDAHPRCGALPKRYFLWTGREMQELLPDGAPQGAHAPAMVVGPGNAIANTTPLPRPPQALAPLIADSVMRIPLRNGDTVELIGNPRSEEGRRRYMYEGHLGDAPFHLVHVQYYEGSGRFLIHDSTGDRAHVDARPIVSPTRRELLVPSWAADDYGTPKSLAIYRIDGDTLVTEFRFDPVGWGPKEARWVGNDTIRVVKGVFGRSAGEYREVPAYLARENGRWVLHGAALDPAPR